MLLIIRKEKKRFEMNTGNKTWILHNDQDCLDEIVGPPSCFPRGCQKQHSKRARRRVIQSPEYQTSCASWTSTVWNLHNLHPPPPSLIPSPPTPERVECFVWQDETGRPALHLSRRNTTTVSPSTQTGLALSGTAPASRWSSIYHSKVLFCSAEGSAGSGALE